MFSLTFREASGALWRAHSAGWLQPIISVRFLITGSVRCYHEADWSVPLTSDDWDASQAKVKYSLVNTWWWREKEEVDRDESGLGRIRDSQALQSADGGCCSKVLEKGLIKICQHCIQRFLRAHEYLGISFKYPSPYLPILIHWRRIVILPARMSHLQQVVAGKRWSWPETV